MKVTLLSHTPEPEKTIAAAAKLCYSSSGIDALLDKLTPEKAAEFVEMLAGLGHESPIEHVSFTFGIEGVSRALLAQITRHRMASYSVQSQRYVKENQFGYVIPPEVEAIPEAKAEFLAAMESAAAHYDKLAAILAEKHLPGLLKTSQSEAQAKSQAEKLAIEDARFVLPNACETKMIVTMNARSLYNFFRHRCCNRAQWEIHELADRMLQLVHAVAPTLFGAAGPGCVAAACPEGKMTCGKSVAVRDRYGRMLGQKESGDPV